MSGVSSTSTTIRRGGLVAYFVVFFWSIFANGIPVDRIAVLLWMLTAFLVASIGRSRDDVIQMVRDWLVLVAIYMAYDYSRGTADQWGIGVNYTLLRDIDRLLFFGNDPGVWMQKTFLRSDVRWYDVGGAIVYMLHFVLPVVPLASLRVRQRTEWIRYVRRFALTLAIAVSVFIMFPAAPPWMSAEKGTLPAHSTHHGSWLVGVELEDGVKNTRPRSRCSQRGGGNALAPCWAVAVGCAVVHTQRSALDSCGCHGLSAHHDCHIGVLRRTLRHRLFGRICRGDHRVDHC